MSLLRKLTRGPSRRQRFTPRGKEGARAYAVGDIHGCLNLLDALLARIAEDAAARGPKRTWIIFLGDLIDRGPASRGVIERLIAYKPDFATPVFIAGNHEEIFLRVLGGEPEILADWLKFGGAECVESYGVDPGSLRRMQTAEAVEPLR